MTETHRRHAPLALGGRLRALGVSGPARLPGTPEELARSQAAKSLKWGRVIKAPASSPSRRCCRPPAGCPLARGHLCHVHSL